MTKKINKTYAIECHGIDMLQEYVDEFVKHKKVVSVSVTVTEGPSDFLALIVYREKKNGQCVVCGAVVCDCADCSSDDEVCWWLGVTASCTSNYPGVHCREDARGMVMMYLYMFQSKDYVRDDCVEEYMVAANTKKEAVKKFRQILNENDAILNFHVQVYSPDWWNVYRYPLEKLELMRFGGETTMPCKIWRDANEHI